MYLSLLHRWWNSLVPTESFYIHLYIIVRSHFPLLPRHGYLNIKMDCNLKDEFVFIVNSFRYLLVIYSFYQARNLLKSSPDEPKFKTTFLQPGFYLVQLQFCGHTQLQHTHLTSYLFPLNCAHCNNDPISVDIKSIYTNIFTSYPNFYQVPHTVFTSVLSNYTCTSFNV